VAVLWAEIHAKGTQAGVVAERRAVFATVLDDGAPFRR